MRSALAALAICLVPVAAQAGAWTLSEGEVQIITSTIISSANKSFDANSDPTEDVVFRKTFTSVYAEYGWNDWLTLIAVPEYASAISAGPGRATEHANDFAVSGGARLRLLNDAGVLSMEAMARSAGAFELDTSFDEKPGEEFELRALYGAHFEMFSRDGCFDVEVAQRWTTGGRPNEVPIDLSLMVDVGWKTQALLQSLNVVSEGAGRPPFDHYRYHKLALSLVRPVWGQTSLQVGGFLSPAGQNALEEEGVFLAIWTKF
ncbi:MAG TPA: hypothetical protein VID67_00665 [Rhizomicrobium sp.]|jgi:hypothetical protein